MPLAMRSDIIDQALAIAMQPTYTCCTAKVTAAMIQCLTQTRETHAYVFRKEVVESMLKICEQRHEMINQQPSQSPQGKMEDTMMVNALKYVHSPLCCMPLLSNFLHMQLWYNYPTRMCRDKVIGLSVCLLSPTVLYRFPQIVHIQP